MRSIDLITLLIAAFISAIYLGACARETPCTIADRSIDVACIEFAAPGAAKRCGGKSLDECAEYRAVELACEIAKIEANRCER